MLDIRLFREKPDIIKDSERKRGKDPKLVDEVIKYDILWRKALQKSEALKHKRNLVSQKIAKLKKEGKSSISKIKEMKKINKDIEENDRKTKEFLRKRDELRYKIGNILDDSVPLGNSEESNSFVRAWGKAKVWKGHVENFREESFGKLSYEVSKFKPESHVDIMERLDLADIKKASEISGARFYFLKNELVILNFALLKFSMDFMIKQGFIPMWTPFMLTKEAISKAAELSDFESMLYKIENEDLFLIATAEQTLACYHMNEVFEKLPKAYVGFSTNFRREAGSHGKDTKGIFRVHQFDKVEQFVFCKPEHSKDWFNKMISNAERIYQKLGIAYRVMNICSGELNDNASLKYDIEVWMPAQGRFREVVSCSNCKDYQARKLNVKFVSNGEKRVVHTLNSTALATGRTIVAILENFQQKDGSIRIPRALIPYTGFKEIKKKE
jgi:seryl-tRNA synthetase